MLKRNNHPLLFLCYLITTTMLCGASVMVVEILGSRVIGPFFGVSLFVWTSLITVTLVALALGYAFGGVMADRKGTPDFLYWIILVAGLLILLIPMCKGVVLGNSRPLGLRSGALLSATLLFGPPLFVLGLVSPYIVRIVAHEMKNIGRTVGLFYAISTAGSVLGTIATGFFLIAYMGVNTIFWCTGAALTCLSVLYFLFFRRKWYLLTLLLAPLFLQHSASPVSKTMPNGTKVALVFSQDSFYGNLKVVDYSYGPVRTRELLIDGLVQGGIDLDTRMPIYDYFYFLEFIPYGLNPAGKTCLVVGLGAGIIPMWYESMGIATDVVDIDPHVVDIARDYFGFRSRGAVQIADARHYLTASGKRYDYIILDVFNGDTTPGYLLSREAVSLLKNRLAGNGILAINLIGGLKEDTLMTASVVKTLRGVFRTVEIYPTFSVSYSDGSGNLALVAYDADTLRFNPDAVKGFPVHPFADISVTQLLGTTFSFPPHADALMLSDDYNPIDFYDLGHKEKVRENVLRNTDADILL